MCFTMRSSSCLFGIVFGVDVSAHSPDPLCHPGENDAESSSVETLSSELTEQLSGAESEPAMKSDFVNYIGCVQSLNNAERLNALQDHFKPNKLFNFPARTEYKKKMFI